MKSDAILVVGVARERFFVLIDLSSHLLNRMTDIKYQMMKFNSSLNIDFVKWSHAKMERDISKADGKFFEEDMPK